MQKIFSQSGQTLIETMVAAFVLVMGISAAVGLSIYSLNSMRNIPKQIIGAGLAREGIEAVKNMRDTNWLKDTLSTGGCWDFYSGSISGNCYLNWLTAKYGINPEGQKTYSLSFNPGNTLTPWLINSTATNFGLNRITDNGTGLSYYGYNPSPVLTSSANSGYARKITLSTDTVDLPFSKPNYQRLNVRVDVWWTNKTCPTLSADVPTQGSCKITLETYLTNWRNY